MLSDFKKQDLENRLKALGIREEDLEEHFVRSSGPGGQKVNKTSSCVVLSHPKSGVEVKCDEARSQAANRELARRRLVEKLEEIKLGEESKRAQEIEKIRRQKRRRSRRAKEKILKDKKIQAEKKSLRSKVF